MSILDNIVAATRQDLAARRQKTTMDSLARQIETQLPPLDFKQVLQGRQMQLIAEVKKASPSRGVICQDFDPVKIAAIYRQGGAAAISVLTETRYFSGSLEYLGAIKKALTPGMIPLLRKDFIIDLYQIYESRAFGADSLLLIAAILDDQQLKFFINKCRELGMEPLVEIHNKAEAGRAIACGAQIIGINNRDLNTFQTDIRTTGILRPLIPPEIVVVSESGIHGKKDMAYLKSCGVNAVLVGEALMAADDIPKKLMEL